MRALALNAPQREVVRVMMRCLRGVAAARPAREWSRWPKIGSQATVDGTARPGWPGAARLEGRLHRGIP
jgi:hypothetical protein